MVTRDIVQKIKETMDMAIRDTPTILVSIKKRLSHLQFHHTYPLIFVVRISNSVYSRTPKSTLTRPSILCSVSGKSAASELPTRAKQTGRETDKGQEDEGLCYFYQNTI